MHAPVDVVLAYEGLPVPAAVAARAATVRRAAPARQRLTALSARVDLDVKYKHVHVRAEDNQKIKESTKLNRMQRANSSRMVNSAQRSLVALRVSTPGYDAVADQ